MLGPEQLSSLLGATRELLALLDGDGSVLYANEGFGRMLGYFSGDLSGAGKTFRNPMRSFLALVFVVPGDRLVGRRLPLAAAE